MDTMLIYALGMLALGTWFLAQGDTATGSIWIVGGMVYSRLRGRKD